MQTKNKIWAIGDPHGCYKELMLLVKQLQKNGLDFKKDIVVVLGDIIDRGPNSRKVVEQCMEWSKTYKNFICLHGNHENLMLDALIYKGQQYHSYDLWWGQGGRQTFESYVPKGRTAYEKSITQVRDVIPYEHLKWLMDRPYYYDSPDYFFVHGAVIPGTSLEDLKVKLDEPVDNEEKQAVIWGRDTFIFSKYDWGKKIIFGHTADYDGHYASPPGSSTFEPIIRKNKIGIDTAVCPPANQKLTAVELPIEKFYNQKSLA